MNIETVFILIMALTVGLTFVMTNYINGARLPKFIGLLLVAPAFSSIYTIHEILSNQFYIIHTVDLIRGICWMLGWVAFTFISIDHAKLHKDYNRICKLFKTYKSPKVRGQIFEDGLNIDTTT